MARREATVVAFDIVGYSRAAPRVQLEQIRSLNRLVAGAIRSQQPGRVLWASGGDGGHVLFFGERWQVPVLDLVRDLLMWAASASAGVRIAAHRGRLELIEGADGRLQPVGDAINTAAHALAIGSGSSVVVSSQFRRAFGTIAGVDFDDERPVQQKHGSPLDVSLMSLLSMGHRSRWAATPGVNHAMLQRAIDAGRGLDAVFYAKRLLQINSEDTEVASALAGLDPIHFRYVSASGKKGLNPILGHLDPDSLRQVIDNGELIERGYGELICKRGDIGTTMFVILRGRVGVYRAVDDTGVDTAQSDVTLREGEIAGELAFALNRRRTADLVSLGDTALLSFDYRHVSRLLGDGTGMAGRLIRAFMNSRAFEHVSQNVPYLVGRQLSALSEDRRRQWRGHLNRLQGGSQVIELPPHRPFRLADLRHCDARRESGGIYILASGGLRSRLAADGFRPKRLDGERFPLLYVDLPHHVVAPDHEYMVDEGRARILFIGLDAINSLPSDEHGKVIHRIKHALAPLYHYDAFISYNFADVATAERWQRALEATGLTVFRDTPTPPGTHYPTRDGNALLDSLTMLVLTSPQATKDVADNWLLKEVRYREEHFDRQPRIVPVRLPGGDPRLLGIMYSSVEPVGREPAAIEEAIQLIRHIRQGATEPPYGVARHSSTLG